MSSTPGAELVRPVADTQGYAIVVEGLRKRYGTLLAVDGISFRVRAHEIFGLLGPNGAGKTTTVEILEGLRGADEGRALVAGIDVRKDPEKVKSVIGVQLQASAFFDGLNLLELLDMFAALYKRSVDAMAILKKVDLTEKARSKVSTLSGGQKQRFSIATRRRWSTSHRSCFWTNRRRDSIRRRAATSGTWRNPFGQKVGRLCSPLITWTRPKPSATGLRSWTMGKSWRWNRPTP